MTHPDFTTLFLAGAKRGAATPPPTVGPHLATCASCRGEWDLAKSVQSAIRSDEMVAPPARVLKNAITLWKQAHPGRLSRAIEVLRAALVFDSLKSPQLATVRRAAVAPRGGEQASRRLLYRAGKFDIDLAIQSSPAGRARAGKHLQGQIVQIGRRESKAAGATVRLEGASRRPVDSRTDARGAFRFDSLAPGRYRLHVRLAGTEILIDPLTVKR